MNHSSTERLVAHNARVTDVDHICTEHVRIELALTSFPASQPGQFLQLLCRDPQAEDIEPRILEWRDGEIPPVANLQRSAFLRRPFSMADHTTADDGTTHIAIISRDIGPGTHWLDQLKRNNVLNISGPFGRGFQLPPNRTRPLLLVGGGVGIPPLLYLARVAVDQGHEDLTLILGAQRRDLMPVRRLCEPASDGTPSICAELPGNVACPTVFTTDDGSLGLRGLVTDAIAARLTTTRTPDTTPLVFACGPEPMLDAIAAQTRKYGVDCQLCIERVMGCGMGTCLSCVVRRRDPTRAAGWRWALSCSEGPVFHRDDLFVNDLHS